MELDWQKLRTWNGSQQSAFEELCCQLAAYEPVLQASKFIRLASPDGGVECFWTLPTGDEWGWQAKFFLSPPDARRWRQIEESIKTTLDKHPRLTRYTICLPIDRPDPRTRGRKSFLDRWNDRVASWQRWAQEKGMSVEFTYWGKHEIFERLSREEHRGRHFFWFNRESLSQQWFERRIDESIANAGPRYTPELNVELPVVRLFAGLGRTSAFLDPVRALSGKIRRLYPRTEPVATEEIDQNLFDSHRQNVTQLLSSIEGIERSEVGPIDWQSMGRLAAVSAEIAWKCRQNLEEVAERRKAAKKPQKEEQNYRRPRDFDSERYHLFELISHLRDLQNNAESREARLSNLPALLLAGDAGTGKTHLLCDVAKRRISDGFPTVLLLGGHFKDGEPWSQIIRLLGLSCTRDEFLGALEAAAQVCGGRALIMIDALNEGEGKTLWSKHLGGILAAISRYPWIGLAVSIRTSYETLAIPSGLVPGRLVREEHHGFADYEYEATKTFFDHFGIQRPAVPLLIPEFQNPLFLKLFCQGLKNRDLTKIPPGLRGVTAIFRFFIESVNEKLSGPEYLDFDPKSAIVYRAAEKLAEMMAVAGQRWLPHSQAKDAVNSVLPRDQYEKSLFRHLISEGVISEDRFYVGDDQWVEGIRFSYERFADHFVVQYLLDKHLNLDDPSQAFLPGQPLEPYVRDENACWLHRGLIEAFSIQLPERIGRELVELVPGCARYHPVREAFVESLIWREPKAISDTAVRYVNDEVIRYEDTHDKFLDALLTVASNPDHPFNADFLHKNLMRLQLAERDAWWSIFLSRRYGEHGAVDRLIDWAWSCDDKSHVSDESVRLCGVALAWFLTSSNRYLRDCATKALVSLLTPRLHVLRGLLVQFKKVDDPYVLERLLAVAYGCAMRSTNDGAIGPLAKDIYCWIFEKGEPPPHILLRDYARGIIELAWHRGMELDLDVKKVRPPYKSDWPDKIPTKTELEEYGKRCQGMPDEEKARLSLYESVMGFGDFARYIIGTNTGHFEWSSRRLGEPRKPSRKEIHDAFVASLTSPQKEAWDRYIETRTIVELQVRHMNFLTTGGLADRPNQKELKTTLQRSEASFRRKLGKKKLKTFDERILPYLNAPHAYAEEDRFDLSIAQRWIFKRVLDLGWTMKRFGKFDFHANRYGDHGRSGTKPERIGKKYQWIAYHEFLARVSDNFVLKGGYQDEGGNKYEGPWQILSARDIDPSFLLKKTGYQRWEPHSKAWWFQGRYNAWDAKADDVEWLKDSEDLPTIESLLGVMKPDNSSKWFVLDTFVEWEEPTPPEQERFEVPSKRLWYIIKSYIIKKGEIENLLEWAERQNFWGRWMPECQDLYDVFVGEFHWAPAFHHHFGQSGHEWTRGYGNRLPKKVLPTATRYIKESTSYDCSIDDTISIRLPTRWIAREMGMHWKGVEGHFYDRKGNLIAFDPSVRASGPSALLMNRDAFLQFLNENGYDLLWTVVGEKNIIGGRMAREDWKGRLEMSGAYRIIGKKIEGAFRTNFVS
jgi:hypothetical protein